MISGSCSKRKRLNNLPYVHSLFPGSKIAKEAAIKGGRSLIVSMTRALKNIIFPNFEARIEHDLIFSKNLYLLISNRFELEKTLLLHEGALQKRES